jgi:thymidylate synthase (FAD)
VKNIRVELLHYTPMPVLLKALEQPYQNDSVTLTLAKRVINVLKHESVSEHVTMNFLISGVSRLELQEHMRHRISSSTVQSTRFTLNKMNVAKYSDYFVLPDYIESDWIDKAEYDKYIIRLQAHYLSFVYSLSEMVDAGIRNDYLKYFVPEGLKTQFVWTINLRALKNFIALRQSKNAHFEIRSVAEKIVNSLANTYVKNLL